MIEVKPHLNLYQYTDDNKVWDINYDGNGNIQQLKRNGRATQNGLDMDQLVYNYGTGNLKNRLLSVSDAVTNSQYTTDIKNGQISNNYQYDESGRLVADLQAGAWYSYDSRGLVTAIYSNATRTIPLITYTYDERGNRSIKTNYDTNGNIVNQTWYVYDSGGNTLAIYERNNQTSTPQLYEQSIYGMSRLGLLRKQQQKYMYELTDHLGNIRAVLGKDESGEAELLSYADYYPFGMEMPGRTNITVSGANWRYGYQGLFAERDGLTGNNDFMLRQYDPRLGRWLTKDPMGQYASPYMAMGNNPVSYIDPTGGADYYIDGMLVSERTFSRLMGNPDFIGGMQSLETNRALFKHNWTTGFSSQFKIDLSDKLLESAKYNRFKKRLEFGTFELVGQPTKSIPGEVRDMLGYRYTDREDISWYICPTIISFDLELAYFGNDATNGGGPDLTSEFNQRVSDMQAVFGAIGNTYNDMYGGPILSYPAKFAAFGYIQYKGARTEFMNPKAFKTSDFYKGGYVNGKDYAADDFGNYFYGVAANAMGITLDDAIKGAGAYAVYRKLLGHNSALTWWNLPGFLDEFKDTKTIIRGYYGN